MRNLLVVVAVVLLGIVGLGFYQGWFHFSRQESDNKSNITLTVDQEKMRADEKKVESMVGRSTETTSSRKEEGAKTTPQP